MLGLLLNHALLAAAVGLTFMALLYTRCSTIVTIYSTSPVHPISVTILQIPLMGMIPTSSFGYQQLPPPPNIVALLGTERCTVVTNYSLNLAQSVMETTPPLLPTRKTVPPKNQTSPQSIKHLLSVPCKSTGDQDELPKKSTTQPHPPPSPNIGPSVKDQPSMDLQAKEGQILETSRRSLESPHQRLPG
jgi:hypothetical protein